MTPAEAASALATFALCGTLVLSATAGEPTGDRATRLFDSGLEAMKREDFAAACPLLAESYQLDRRLGALFTLAECEARGGMSASAWEHFGAYLERVETLEPDQRAAQAARIQEAERRRSGLEPEIPLLTIDVPTDLPPGATVDHNGRRVERADWGVPRRIDPGRHAIVLRVPDGRMAETVVEIEPGEREQVRLAVEAPPTSTASAAASAPPTAASTPGPPPDSVPGGSTDGPMGPQHIAGWVTLGVGAAGMITALVATAVLLDKKEVVEANCEGSLCNDAGFAEAEDVPTLNWVGSVGFGVGVAGLAAGALLLLTAPAPSSAEVAGWRLRAAAPGAALGLSLRAGW
ncbi:MAG: hypothetical protein JRI23_10325 [Deltaproteobacteria bacterium]|jgi:hypothetical protein|nr:hypothetical protein [Deltaproteobacteria bacterium]MBW2532064.1 hypothetical protein [Deltaproteobacteria bacterium]